MGGAIVRKTMSENKIKLPRWTEEEVQILRDNYRIYGTSVRRLLPGRSQTAIMRKANALGLRVDSDSNNRTSYDGWTAKELSTLMEFYPVIGKDVQQYLPRRTLAAIYSKVIYLGLKKNRV